MFKDKTLRTIWRLAFPVMIGQALHTVLVLTDMWFITRLGTVEAAAAGTGTSLLGVIQVFPILVSAGVVALVARETGAQNKDKIKEITATGIGLSLIIGALITIFSFLMLDQLLWIFGDADQSVLLMSRRYVGIGLFGLPFFFSNATTRSVVQATGDTRTPVKVFVFANLLNICLDYVFIYVFQMGISGAAIATVMAEIVAFFLMIRLTYASVYEKSFDQIKGHLRLQLHTAIRILKIGGYAVLQMITRPFTGLIMYRLVLTHGVPAGAAFGIGGRLFNFVFIFLAGLGTAVSVMVGQNLGKGDQEGNKQLLRQGVILAGLNMLFFAVPFYIFPSAVMRFFVNDPETIAIGAMYLRITYTGVLFAALSTVFGAAFSGAGDTFPPMIASLIGNWAIKIPLAYALSPQGSNGIWLAIALSVVIESLIMTLWFRKGKWQHKVI